MNHWIPRPLFQTRLYHLGGLFPTPLYHLHPCRRTSMQAGLRRNDNGRILDLAGRLQASSAAYSRLRSTTVRSSASSAEPLRSPNALHPCRRTPPGRKTARPFGFGPGLRHSMLLVAHLELSNHARPSFQTRVYRLGNCSRRRSTTYIPVGVHPCRHPRALIGAVWGRTGASKIA